MITMLKIILLIVLTVIIFKKNDNDNTNDYGTNIDQIKQNEDNSNNDRINWNNGIKQ